MNFNWIFFSLLSVACSVTYSLLSKKVLNNEDDHDPIAYASTLFQTVAILSAIAYFFTSFNPKDFQALTNLEVWKILLPNLILYSVGPSLYWRALKHLPASEVSILYNLTTLYIFILAVSFGTETFSVIRLIGGLCIVAAAIIIGIFNQHKSKVKVNKYFWMLMASTILYAFAALTDNVIITKAYFSPLFFQMINFGIPSVLILLINPFTFKHLKKMYRPKVLKHIWMNGVFFFISFWAIFQAYKSGGVTSEVNFVLATETVLTVALASFLLGEKKHMKMKILCACIVSVGIYLLS